MHGINVYTGKSIASCEERKKSRVITNHFSSRTCFLTQHNTGYRTWYEIWYMIWYCTYRLWFLQSHRSHIPLVMLALWRWDSGQSGSVSRKPTEPAIGAWRQQDGWIYTTLTAAHTHRLKCVYTQYTHTYTDQYRQTKGWDNQCFLHVINTNQFLRVWENVCECL